MSTFLSGTDAKNQSETLRLVQVLYCGSGVTIPNKLNPNSRLKTHPKPEEFQNQFWRQITDTNFALYKCDDEPEYLERIIKNYKR